MKIQQHDGSIIEMEKGAPEALEVLNHSTSHLLAQAVKSLYPNAQFGYGPAIENGFYYDIDFGDKVLVEDDLAAIEKRMKEIASKDLRIERKQVSKDEALEIFKHATDKSYVKRGKLIDIKYKLNNEEHSFTYNTKKGVLSDVR